MKALHLFLLTVLVAALVACGTPWMPAYEGEPECGSSSTLHAVVDAGCDGAITVACDCEERRTLECASGSWAISHWGCARGFGVVVQDGGR